MLLWAEPEELTGDAAANFRILAKTDVPIEVFGAAEDAARLSKLSGAPRGSSTRCWAPVRRASPVRRWMP